MPDPVRRILRTLQKGGYRGYIVGGCVRDALIGRVPNDYDITTNAKPEEIKALFPHTIDTGIQHGTVTVRMNHESYEVTTFRVDGAYLDNRHPESVSFTDDLAEDLIRRDFTINAMAYNDEEGLVDLFGGQQDLENRVIRAVGDPEQRFKEDALRIMRCVRFGAQLGFTIDHDTYLAAIKLSDTLRFISAERIREELMKILTSDRQTDVSVLDDVGALDSFFPEYRRNRERTNELLAVMPKDRIMRLTGLLGRTGERFTDTYQTAERFFDALKFDNDTKNTVLHVLRFGRTDLKADRVQLRRFLNAAGKENCEYILTFIEKNRSVDLSDVRREISDILVKGECTSLKELAISGKDLISMGMRPGKEMGEILMELLSEVLSDPVKNTRETLLRRAAEIRKKE